MWGASGLLALLFTQQTGGTAAKQLSQWLSLTQYRVLFALTTLAQACLAEQAVPLACWPALQLQMSVGCQAATFPVKPMLIAQPLAVAVLLG